MQLTVANPVPALAGGVTLNPYYDGIELLFDRPSDPDFAGVKVYVSTVNGFTPSAANLKYDGPHSKPLFIDGLLQGTTYYVKFVLYDIFGESTISSQYSTTTTTVPEGDTAAPSVPNAGAGPTITSIVRESKLYATGELKVAWTASTDNSGRVLYRLEYWTDPAKKTVVETPDLSYTIFPAQIGIQYSARVLALDYTGNASAFTPQTNHTITGDSMPPANVTAATATAGLDKVTVEWTNPTDADFIEVKVYRGTASGFTPDDATNLVYRGRGDTFVDTKVTNGTAYYYKFKTLDVSGNATAASAATASATPFKITSANVSAYFEAAAIGDAFITNLNAVKITAGDIAADRYTATLAEAVHAVFTTLSAMSADLGEVTAGVATAITIRTAAADARVQLDSTNGIQAYDSGSVQRVAIRTDGSGYLGSQAAFSWTAAGVLTISAANVTGTLTGNTIQTSDGNPRVIINTADGFRALNESGVVTAQIRVDGSGFFGVGADQISWDTDGALLVKTVRTATSGQRMEILASDNEMHFYGARGKISGTYTRAGTTVTCQIYYHGLSTGDSATLDFTGGASDGAYTVTVLDVHTFTVTDAVSGTASGAVDMTRPGSVFELANIGITAVDGSDTVGQFGSFYSGTRAIWAGANGTASEAIYVIGGRHSIAITSLPGMRAQLILGAPALSSEWGKPPSSISPGAGWLRFGGDARNLWLSHFHSGEAWNKVLTDALQPRIRALAVDTGRAQQHFMLAIGTDGCAYGMGQNDNHKIGAGRTGATNMTPRWRRCSIPLHDSTADYYVQEISAGRTWGLALRSDGSMFSWGQNNQGQCGDGTTTDVVAPKKIVAPTAVAKVKATGYLTNFFQSGCITTDGNLHLWGDNSGGQCGIGNIVTPKSSPQLVAKQGAANWKDFWIDGRTCWAWTDDFDGNKLYAWGYNNRGQVGDGTTVDKSSPTAVLVDGGVVQLTNVKKVRSCGHASSYSTTVYALLNNGNLYAWGYGATGGIGNGLVGDKSKAVKIGGAGTAIGAVADFSCCGNSSIMVLTQAGELYGWGQNTNQCLSLSAGQKNSPTLISPAWTGTAVDRIFSSSGSGRSFFLVVTTSGHLYICGDNNHGHMGYDSTLHPTSFTEVVVPRNAKNAFANGQIIDYAHTQNTDFSTFDFKTSYLLLQSGEMLASGYGGTGELGDGLWASTSITRSGWSPVYSPL